VRYLRTEQMSRISGFSNHCVESYTRVAELKWILNTEG
jgi:hypothetical protein